jgi:hypothetical protein
MARHPFDPLSLSAGLVFTVCGLLLLSGGLRGLPMQWAGPLTALVLAGIVVLAARSSRRPGDEEEVSE